MKERIKLILELHKEGKITTIEAELLLSPELDYDRSSISFTPPDQWPVSDLPFPKNPIVDPWISYSTN